MKKTKSFWKDGLSVKETKFSILAVLLVLSFVYCLTYSALTRQLDGGLIELFNALLLAFAGVSAVDRVSSAYENRSTTDDSYSEGYTEESESEGGNNNV